MTEPTKALTLEEAKNKYAIQQGYSLWIDLAKDFHPKLIERAHNEAAQKFQDEVGQFVADAVNEKIERLKTK